MKCPVCEAPSLTPVAGSETSVVCGACKSTLSRCIYCAQTTFRLLGEVCACVNPACIANGVPWRHCRDDDRYEREKRVFEGGMGEIWQAHDRLLGRRVALKIARHDIAANPAARGQFLKEARIGARLLHPNVLPVFDVGIDREKRVYFTMR